LKSILNAMAFMAKLSYAKSGYSEKNVIERELSPMNSTIEFFYYD